MKEMQELKGLQINTAELNNVDIDPRTSEHTNSFNISWLGSSGVTNSASVQQDNYNGKSLGIEFVVSGTPTLWIACTITVIPKNCEFKSGAEKLEIPVDGGNLNQTFIRDITPKASYAGQTVKFAVSIRSAQNAVLYVRGDIGYFH